MNKNKRPFVFLHKKNYVVCCISGLMNAMRETLCNLSEIRRD